MIKMVLFASELKRKNVVAADGKMLGKVKGMLVDEVTGEITHLGVEPFEEVDARAFVTDEEGTLIFPFEKVQSVKDVVMVLTT